MNSEKTNTPAAIAGARESVVRHFSIEGLYGYRSLALDSEFAATILIAKNGAGKTTLLGALDAFLLGQFTRFIDLEFSTIKLRLRGVEEDLVVTSEQIQQLEMLVQDPELLNFAKSYELEPLALLSLVIEDFPALSESEAFSNSQFYKIYSKLGYEPERARTLCKTLGVTWGQRAPQLEVLRGKVRLALKDYEIVYLPTFRRVELSLPDLEDKNRPGPARKLGLMARLGMVKRGLYAGDVQFGLADISERLRRLNDQMVFESNQGYQEISANIINDLITGVFESGVPASIEDRPSKEALALFFERIKTSRGRYGPLEKLNIPNLDRIYDGNIPESSVNFLNYFLGKLNTVMAKTQGIEDLVEEFIRNCNRYLSAEDSSTSPVFSTGDPRSKHGFDDKLLKLDRRNLQVSVSSVSTSRRVPLDALSSGEKQMISLFARLYLYPGKQKIVLIDEPELSLSLNWQRTILVDIVAAASCSQVIAITHSPFVFDNELDEFATSLKLKLDTTNSRPLEEESNE